MKINKTTWIPGVLQSGFNLVCALVYARAVEKNYFVNLFYFADIFLNALSGGNPDVTVSARVGRYAHYYRYRTSLTARFWLLMECMINTTFYPLDGTQHCEEAYDWTMRVIKDEHGNPPHIHHGPAWLFIILLLVSSIMCLFLFFLLRILAFVGMLPKVSD